MRQGDERRRLLDRLDAKRRARRSKAGAEDDNPGSEEVGEQKSIHINGLFCLLDSLSDYVSGRVYCFGFTVVLRYGKLSGTHPFSDRVPVRGD